MQGITPSHTSYHNPNQEQTDLPGTRDAAYLSWRAEVAAELNKAGYAKEAEKFGNCADPACVFSINYSEPLPDGVIGVYVCDDDPHHKAKAIVPTCQLRICPDCAHRQTARLMNQYVPALLDLEKYSDTGHTSKHVVLTTPISLYDPDCKEKTRDLAKLVPVLFDKVAGKTWRDDSGLLVAWEFGEEGLKLHFHCIWFGAYLPQAKLSQEWSNLTNGLASVVWIEQLDRTGEDGRTLESAVAEVVKYATKLAHRSSGGTWEYMPSADVVTLLGVLKGSRRVRSYGLLNGIDIPEREHVCPVCEAQMVRLSAIEWDIWRETGWMPDEAADALSPSLFKSILANNFNNDPPPENSIPTAICVPLPTFEQLVHKPAWADSIN